MNPSTSRNVSQLNLLPTSNPFVSTKNFAQVEQIVQQQFTNREQFMDDELEKEKTNTIQFVTGFQHFNAVKMGQPLNTFCAKEHPSPPSQLSHRMLPQYVRYHTYNKIPEQVKELKEKIEASNRRRFQCSNGKYLLDNFYQERQKREAKIQKELHSQKNTPSATSRIPPTQQQSSNESTVQRTITPVAPMYMIKRPRLSFEHFLKDTEFYASMDQQSKTDNLDMLTISPLLAVTKAIKTSSKSTNLSQRLPPINLSHLNKNSDINAHHFSYRHKPRKSAYEFDDSHKKLRMSHDSSLKLDTLKKPSEAALEKYNNLLRFINMELRYGDSILKKDLKQMDEERPITYLLKLLSFLKQKPSIMHWETVLSKMKEDCVAEIAKQNNQERKQAKHMWFNFFQALLQKEYSAQHLNPTSQKLIQQFKLFVENDEDVSVQEFFKFIGQIDLVELNKVDVQHVCAAICTAMAVPAPFFYAYFDYHKIPYTFLSTDSSVHDRCYITASTTKPLDISALLSQPQPPTRNYSNKNNPSPPLLQKKKPS